MDPTPLRSIVRAAIELTSRHDRDAVLDAILGELERLVPFDAASVMIVDGDRLRVVAARGFRRDVDLARLRFDRGENPRLDRALDARGTVLFTDPHAPDPFDGLTVGALDHLHSCMAAPMRLDGTLVGVISADAYRANTFDERHAELLELFAALAGVAIRNADLVHELEHARAKLQGEVTTLAEEIRDAAGGTRIVGVSDAARTLRDEIAIVGPTDSTVLILGETGTGKELVARALHDASHRRERPLIRFDASAVAPSLIESELYGHAKGAFTGAVTARAGKFEIADGSTLFLDEIGELPLSLQPRLLRALQERETERIGESRVRKFDVRIIAATNRDLEAEVRAGRFRADLFHRLSVYPIRVPTLAERTADLPALVDHFARKLAPRLRLERVTIDDSFLEVLRGYGWPGNVRELENTVERALVRARARGESVARLDSDAARALGMERAGVPATRQPLAPLASSLREATDRFQLELIERALGASHGSIAGAARLLSEDRSNLHRRYRRLQRAAHAGDPAERRQRP